MVDIDDEVLAYAIGLARSFKLSDPVPGKSKKSLHHVDQITVRGMVDKEFGDRSRHIVHLIARLMSEKSIKVRSYLKPLLG